MSKAATTKLIYKPDSQKTDEYILFVNPEEYKKYADGDTSIPIVDVVSSYDVFFSTQGNQGKLGKASKQQLENVFNTSNDTSVAEFMIKNGVMQHADRIGDSTANKNQSRGGAIGGTPSY